ncbi:hypothetical protein, partial [Helicobacter pylori]|uniref:hypothetical protein n=2 Tax=Helicobacter pylori TaxID=210 RepID=UPI003466F5E7
LQPPTKSPQPPKECFFDQTSSFIILIVKNVLSVFKFCDQYLIKTKQENEIALQLNKKLKYITSFENPMNV